jgi:hypothetical protein
VAVAGVEQPAKRIELARQQDAKTDRRSEWIGRMARGKRARRALMSQTGVFPLFSAIYQVNREFICDAN